MTPIPCYGKYKEENCKGMCGSWVGCRDKFLSTSVTELAKHHGTVTSRSSSIKENLSNTPKSADGSFWLTYCEKAPPRAAMEAAGLVYPFSLKYQFERHETWALEQGFKGYGHVPICCYLVPACETSDVVLLDPWVTRLYTSVVRPEYGRHLRCRLCGGWLVESFITPETDKRWQKKIENFTSSSYAAPKKIPSVFDYDQEHKSAFPTTAQQLVDALGNPKGMTADNVKGIHPTPFEKGVRTPTSCQSQYEHTCRGELRTVSFHGKKTGRLSTKRYNFCEAAIDRHYRDGNQFEIIGKAESYLEDELMKEAPSPWGGLNVVKELEDFQNRVLQGLAVPKEFLAPLSQNTVEKYLSEIHELENFQLWQTVPIYEMGRGDPLHTLGKVIPKKTCYGNVDYMHYYKEYGGVRCPGCPYLEPCARLCHLKENPPTKD